MYIALCPALRYSLKSTVNFPHIIQYQEIPRKNIIETANQNNTIKYDDIEPNSVAEYIMDGHGDVQFFDVSWNFQNNLGYLALENGNGRITLMSIPNMNEFKVCMPCHLILISN